jgi:hypothetical protein
MFVMLSDGLHGVVETKEDDVKFFGVGESMEESSYALVARKLSLFWRLSIPLSKCVSPLAWWWSHESQFPNVGFLAIYFLRFFSFKLKQKECLTLLMS